MQKAIRSPRLEDSRENFRRGPQRSRERTSGGGVLRSPALLERGVLAGVSSVWDLDPRTRWLWPARLGRVSGPRSE